MEAQGEGARAAALWSAAAFVIVIGVAVVLLAGWAVVGYVLAPVAAGVTLSIAVARLSAATPGGRRGPSLAIAISLVGLTLVLSARVGGISVVIPIPLVMSVVGGVLGARIARDHQRLVPGASRGELARRALRGLLLALPFAIVAVAVGTRDTTGESSEEMFYRVIFIVPICGLLAGWFASGAVAPGYAWLRSRGSVARGTN